MGPFRALAAQKKKQSTTWPIRPTDTSLTSQCGFEGNHADWICGISSKSSGTAFFTSKNVHVAQVKVPPRLELGSLDSKSKVLTIAPRHPMYPYGCGLFFGTTLVKACQGEVARIGQKQIHLQTKYVLLCSKHFTQFP